MWCVYLCLSGASAATWTVPGDYNTVETALENVAVNDTIQIDASQGTLEEAVVVTSSVNIVGINGRPVLLAAGDAEGFFKVDADGGVVLLENLTIDGGKQHRGIHLTDGSLTLQDVTLQHTSYDGGGAIAVDAGADALMVYDSTFEDTTSDSGGGIAMLGGDLLIEDSMFSWATATVDGGWIHALGTSNITILRSSFSLGTATGKGGALALANTGGTLIEGSTFTGNVTNSTDLGGGAIFAEVDTPRTLTDNTFSGNAADHDGGALYQRGGVLTLSGNTFCDNTAGRQGGGMYIHDHAGSESTRDVFLRNHAVEEGGGMRSRKDVVVKHASLALNTAALGAAVAIKGGSSTIDDSYIADHPGPGAALWANNAQELEVETSAFERNDMGNAEGALALAASNLLLGPKDGSGIVTPPAIGCDRLWMTPAIDGLLVGAASDKTTIGALEPEPDLDGDGAVGDCDDTDDTIYPGAPEVVGDGIDQDCDGLELCWLDSDGDGYGHLEEDQLSDDLTCDGVSVSAVSGDCEDGDPEIHPEATDVPGDGVDQDCDGLDTPAPPDGTPNGTTGDTADPTGDDDRPGTVPQIGTVGCTCDGSGGSGGVAMVFALALIVGRRRGPRV